MTEHTCDTCHYGQQEYNKTAPCFVHDCFNDHNHPNWVPYTNGDTIRGMTDAQLAHFLARNYGGSVGQYLTWLKGVNVIENGDDGK